MTERLYLHDSYRTTFRATVRDIRPGDREREWHVLLDQTAFYPTAGGQRHDTGMLGAAHVLDVIEEGDDIVHVCDRAPGEGVVTGTVDWPTRFDHMQQHSGQHLLSAILEESFHATTVSFHMGEETSTIDLAILQLSAEALGRAEDMVNESIWANEPVHARFVSDEERATLPLRKDPAVTSNVRVVSIAHIDHSPCGGTHVRATGELGALHLLNTEKIRQTTRLTFVCGGRALRHARARRAIVSALAARFTTRDSEIVSAMEKLDDTMRASRKQGEALTLEIARADAREVTQARGAGPSASPHTDTDTSTNTNTGPSPSPSPDSNTSTSAHVRIASGWSGERAAEFARTVAAAGAAAAVLVPSADTGKGADIIVAIPAGNERQAGTVMREVCALVGGKGGGTGEFARGALAPTADLEAAAAALRERLG